MKKNLSKLFALMIVMIPGSMSFATECAECGKQIAGEECYLVEASELPFRNRYKEILRNELGRKKGITSRDELDSLYDMYHRPPSAKEIHDAVEDAWEHYIAPERLNIPEIEFSVAEMMTPIEVREDLQKRERLAEEMLRGAKENRKSVCHTCIYGRPVKDGESGWLETTTPLNIQLSIALKGILDESDVVVILHEHDKKNSAARLVYDFMRLFNRSAVVLGEELYDSYCKDFSRNRYQKVREMLARQFGPQGIREAAFAELVSLISEYALPQYGTLEYSRVSCKIDPYVQGFLAFIESRCPDTFCFALETPVSTGNFLHHTTDDPDVNQYYQQICEKIGMDIWGNPKQLTMLPARARASVLTTSLRYRLTETCNRDIARKVARYFSAVNQNRTAPDSPRVRFIITIGSKHGVRQKAGVVNQGLIQELIVDELAKIGLDQPRVTTILACPGYMSELFPVAAGAASGIDVENWAGSSIDYLLKFQIPLKTDEVLDETAFF
ncbi:hypothetical protein P0136_08155 [Lentisphaerota bacterium ZTH]|nr:hypothetical protein JYG24_00735 [Lentisphaerota bacterium]WET05336.1 hypothetical protein P0136_08155 [Lentisphaerota bacterium ZTH]